MSTQTTVRECDFDNMPLGIRRRELRSYGCIEFQLFKGRTVVWRLSNWFAADAAYMCRSHCDCVWTRSIFNGH